MKYFFFISFLWASTINCIAQVKDSALPLKDSPPKERMAPKPNAATRIKPEITIKKVKSDSTPTAVAVAGSTTKVSDSNVTRFERDSGIVKAKPDITIINAAKSATALRKSEQQQANERYNAILRTHPYFNFFGKPRYEIILNRTETGKDGLFYLLTGVVLYFALVRLLFAKYMNNLFAVFFRVSLKQKQIREQLLQSPLPSLLLNIFFIISGGIYISFLLRYYNYGGTVNLWFLMLNSTIALGMVYVVKYLILKLTGWIFNIAEATDTYAFVVFLVNKLLGILLIPFLILLAFSAASITSVLITLSFSVVAIFFAYRYIISYAPVRKEIKVSQFHFLLYLCAFEIIPLLLIYKVLLTFLEKGS